MTDSLVKVEARDGVGWISIDRPPLNVINVQICREIGAAVARFDADPAVGVIALTSEGERAFAAGADVAEHTDALVAELGEAIYGLVDRLRAPEGKPRIAVIKGRCSGGGNELAFACDFVVARDDAHFSLAEIDHVGAVGSLGAYLWSLRISRDKALELALTGETLHAAEAKAAGLAVAVLPTEGYAQALDAYLAKFTAKSRDGLRIGRGQLRRAFADDSKAVLAALCKAQLEESVKTEDYAEGIQAFFERRKPVWVHLRR